MQSTRSAAALAVAIFVIAALGASTARAQRRGDCGGAEATGWRASMVPGGEPGEPMTVSGRVLDSAGKGMAGVHLLAYQTDAEGYYSRRGADEGNARLCAVVQTSGNGEYALDTIRPASYPSGGVPAHIHFELWSETISRLRMDLQFADDELLPDRRKTDLTRTSTVRPVTRGEDGVLRVERDFRLP